MSVIRKLGERVEKEHNQFLRDSQRIEDRSETNPNGVKLPAFNTGVDFESLVGRANGATVKPDTVIEGDGSKGWDDDVWGSIFNAPEVIGRSSVQPSFTLNVLVSPHHRIHLQPLIFPSCKHQVLHQFRRIQDLRLREYQLCSQHLGHHGWVLRLSQLSPSINLLSHHPCSSRVGQTASQLHHCNLNDLRVTRFRLRCYLHKSLITVFRYLTSPPRLRVLLLLRRDISHQVTPHYNLLLLHSQYRRPLYMHHHFRWGAY